MLYQRRIEVPIATRKNMSLHGGTWRIHASAIDDIQVISDSLRWLSGHKAEISMKRGKSARGAPQTTLFAKMSKKGAAESLARMSKRSLDTILEEGLNSRIDDEKTLHLRISLSDLVRGYAEICQSDSITVAKGRFKIAVYPGQDVVSVATDLISLMAD